MQITWVDDDDDDDDDDETVGPILLVVVYTVLFRTTELQLHVPLAY